MAIIVDIADRLYDYTDEEVAAGAIEAFQAEAGLSDEDVLAVWGNPKDPRWAELDRSIIIAIDANGSAKRSANNIPSGIGLAIYQN